MIKIESLHLGNGEINLKVQCRTFPVKKQILRVCT